MNGVKRRGSTAHQRQKSSDVGTRRTAKPSTSKSAKEDRSVQKQIPITITLDVPENLKRILLENREYIKTKNSVCVSSHQPRYLAQHGIDCKVPWCPWTWQRRAEREKRSQNLAFGPQSIRRLPKLVSRKWQVFETKCGWQAAGPGHHQRHTTLLWQVSSDEMMLNRTLTE